MEPNHRTRQGVSMEGENRTGQRTPGLAQPRRVDSSRIDAAQGLVSLQRSPRMNQPPSPPRTLLHSQIPNETFWSDSDAAVVLSAMRTTKTDAQLRDALWYLGAHNFNTAIAIQGFELDTIDRYGAPMHPGTRNEVRYQSENPNVDRGLALPGSVFDRTKLEVFIKQNTRLTTYSFPNTSTFDQNNIEHVKALNRWRHEKIRAKVGRAIPNQSGERYHPQEILFLEELFMHAGLNISQTSATDYKKTVDYKTITAQHTSYFAGQDLPGRYLPAPTRTQSSITGAWLNKHVKPQVGTDDLKHNKAARAHRDSGKFKTRRMNLLKAMGRHDEAAALAAEPASGDLR